jgi:hypothetical protein
MNVIDKIELFLKERRTIGRDPSIDSFIKQAAKKGKGKSKYMKNSPSERKSKKSKFEKMMKTWKEEEEKQKYGYSK